jgi:CPA2 family monovalent cation:H+ antiporter-2
LQLTNPENLAHLAELGVVFLLFLIGLELSFERLMTMRRLVFGLGTLQVVITLAVLAVLAVAFGYAIENAIVIAAALSLSSTAIVVQLLSEQKRMGSHTGRASFSVLLLQDLAVIPILMLVAVLGTSTEGPLLGSIALSLAKAALAIGVIVLVGRYALRPLLRAVAGTRSSDMFMAVTLLIAVGTGVAASVAGLSMALGAFIAGLMLAETEYRRAIEAIIEPFKGLLLGAFFLLVGLNIGLEGLAHAPLRILGLALALVVLKAAIIYALARLFGFAHNPAVESALLLGPCGEFAFVIIKQAQGAGSLARAETAEAELIVTLTMLAIPLLAYVARKVIAVRKRASDSANPAEPPPEGQQQHVIIAGFGRVGHLIGAMLAEHRIPYIAVDADAELVALERKAGHPVYFGDAANPHFLARCGLAEARSIAVTMDSPARVDDVVATARSARADLKIIARARDERHAIRLYGKGVTEAVPETIESSLQLGEALLVESGVPMGLAIASVHERRDGFRKLLGRPNRRDEMDRLRHRRKKALP